MHVAFYSLLARHPRIIVTKMLLVVSRRDEDNLEENERIKKELNPRKIDEPKTPYLSPQGTEDEAEMLGKFFVSFFSLSLPIT